MDLRLIHDHLASVNLESTVSNSISLVCCLQGGRPAVIYYVGDSGDSLVRSAEALPSSSVGCNALVGDNHSLIYIPSEDHRRVFVDAEPVLTLPTVVYRCVLARGRPRVLIAQEHRITLYDVAERQVVADDFQCHLSTSPVMAICSAGDVFAFVAPSGDSVHVSDGKTVVLQIPIQGGIYALSFGCVASNGEADSSITEKLAISCAKGTQVLVYLLQKSYRGGVWHFAEPVLQFKLFRGGNASQLACLSFNLDDTLLSGSGDSGTVHIWELKKENIYQSSYLSMWTSNGTKSSSKLYLASGDGPSVCCIAGLAAISQDAGFVWVVTSSGTARCYSLQNEGAWTIEHEYSL